MPIVDVPRAIEKLKSGGVVAIPTETVYGLAGRIDREDTLKRIFTMKQRPFFDPLIVHVHDLAQARALAAEWPALFDDLTAAFWPGPLTLVTRKTAAVSDLITSGLDTVALRSPRHPVALRILKELGVPFAAPSANRFGRTSPTHAQDVLEELGEETDVVDGGASEVGVESTVVEVERDSGGVWQIRILRPGAIGRAELRKALTPKHRIEITRKHSATAPGNVKTHYQPANPVAIVANPPGADPRASLERQLGRRDLGKLHWLKLGDQPEQAARRLYSDFRRLSVEPGVILIERTPANSTEDWEAIWDRIERAASIHI